MSARLPYELPRGAQPEMEDDMTNKKTALGVIAATIAFAGAALAQGQGQGPVAAACGDDIAKFCAGKEHGGGVVRGCLEANKDKVSEACKTALNSTGPGRGRGRGMGGMGGGMGGMGVMGRGN